MIHIDLPVFKKLYYEEKRTMRAIANYFQCTAHVLYKRMREEKLPFREKVCAAEDVTGQKFNQITFVKYIKNDKFGKALWLCRCDCGKEKVLNASAIKANLTTSCGCNKARSLRKQGFQSISWGYFRKLERSALSRDYSFEVSMEDLWTLYCKQKGQCAVSGVSISLCPDSNRERLQTASLDRIDSKIGYTLTNVQWVHKRINRLKNILDTDELLFWARKICTNQPDAVTKEFDTNSLTWD